MNYHLKYYIEVGEYTRAQADGHGLTDAVVIASILRGPQAHVGEKSIAIVSADGHNRGQEIPSTELFQVWTILADMLTQEEDLPKWQKAMAESVISAVRKMIVDLATKGNTPE
jgi:hypothetical protein